MLVTRILTLRKEVANCIAVYPPIVAQVLLIARWLDWNYIALLCVDVGLRKRASLPRRLRRSASAQMRSPKAHRVCGLTTNLDFDHPTEFPILTITVNYLFVFFKKNPRRSITYRLKSDSEDIGMREMSRECPEKLRRRSVTWSGTQLYSSISHAKEAWKDGSLDYSSRRSARADFFI